MIRQLLGDCRVTLPTLASDSIQSVVTSPPYWGLRDYGTEPLVWGGEVEHEHDWNDHVREVRQPPTSANSTLHPCPTKANVIDRPNIAIRSGFCSCGAWLGSLGLEPTPDLYIDHLVECFRHVRRVLRDDGVLWLNLGDSYAGSGNGAHDYRKRNKNQSLSLHPDKYKGQSTRSLQRVGPQEHTEGNGRVHGYKPKDLMMMPFRVAMALQADGWYLRSVIPWVKRNSMPESVTDRPSTAVEYIFMFSKSARYYWDADAIRSISSPNTHDRRKDGGVNPKTANYDGTESVRPKNNVSMVAAINARVESRNRRNSDWFLESWQGLMLDEQDDPLAFVVNPQPFTGAHFATFPPKLVEPMVKASTSEKSQCPECGAPWARVVEKTGGTIGASWHSHENDIARGQRGGTSAAGLKTYRIEDRVWRPTCKHEADPVPQTILDPFSGAGTVGLVADRLGRNAVLCELKDGYSRMSHARIVGDAPMFAEIVAD